MDRLGFVTKSLVLPLHEGCKGPESQLCSASRLPCLVKEDACDGGSPMMGRSELATRPGQRASAQGRLKEARD